MSHWIVRHYNAGCAVCAAAVVLLCLFVLHPLGVPFAVMALAAFFLALVWVGLYCTANKRLGAAAVHALEEECDPEPLLTLSREQLASRRRGREAGRPTALSCRLNIVTALTCLGRDGEAGEELDALGRLLPPKPSYFHVLYILDRSSACFRLGQAREMAGLLDQAQSLVETLSLAPAQAELCRLLLRVNRAAWRYLAEGPTPELEEVYRALLAEAPSRRMKVGYHLTLGRFALARGGQAEARAHLAYAAEHGNKLHYRAEAERLLADLAPAP